MRTLQRKKVKGIRRLGRKAEPEVKVDHDSAIIRKHAKKYIQAAGVRLVMEKIEKECKAEIDALMLKRNVASHYTTVHVGETRVNVEIKREASTRTVLDIDKLEKVMTPKQLKKCSKVSITAAQEVLPQALIDKCSDTVTGEPSVRITAKGCPLPTVNFN